MELRIYLAVVRKWLWLIVLSVAIAATSSYLASRAATPLYQTKTTLMVGRAIQSPDPTSIDLWASQQLATIYVQMVTREPILHGAIESLGLQMDWRALAGQVHAAAIPQTQFLEISVVDSNPQRAKALADAIARQLIIQSPSTPASGSQQDLAFVQQQLADLKGKIEGAQEEIRKLKAELDAATSARRIQDLQNQISVLEGKITGWQNTYAQLLTFVQGGQINVLTVVEEAAVPMAPISPNVPMNVLLASTIGLVLAVGGAFLIEYIDDTVKTPDDVARTANLPILGAIARFGGDDYPQKLIAAQHPRSPIVEAYRVLRTNIQFSTIDKPLRTLMVTSPGPVEGKSVTLANLAVVMAQSGLRVIVVDSDLRRPVLHKIFGLPNEHGLSNAILQANPGVTEHLQDTPVENLRVLTSGPIPPNPAELLGSERMQAVIEELKGEADLVLFDSPPALVVADAAILGTRTDGALVVYDAGHTRRSAARQAVEELRRVQVNPLGVVLNRLSRRRGGYYYYYHYYYYRTEDGERRKRRRRQRRRTGLARRFPFLADLDLRERLAGWLPFLDRSLDELELGPDRGTDENIAGG